MAKRVRGTCGVVGCDVKGYARFRGAGPELCSRHYQQVQKLGMVLEMKDESEVEEVVPNFPAPTVAHHTKRCTAKINGMRCPRKKVAKGLCPAHHKEQMDREQCEIRPRPLEAIGGGFENERGERELIARLEGQHAE